MILLATCDCGPALALKQAAKGKGYEIEMDIVTRSDDRTRRAAELGLGLPVLIRQDGCMSNDAVTWVRGKRKKI